MPGLGWIDATVVKFRVNDKLKYKIPHIGWSHTIAHKKSILQKNIPDLTEFYFIHSYHLLFTDKSDILSETMYENKFPSAIEKENIFGVQFHPEKSHKAGAVLLENFISF